MKVDFRGVVWSGGVTNHSRLWETSPSYWSWLLAEESNENTLEAIKLEQPSKLFIIGGGVVYRQAMELADEMIITLVHKEYEGDTFFPEYRSDIGLIWEETSRIDVSEDLSFIHYTRV